MTPPKKSTLPVTEPTLIAVSSASYPTLPETYNEFNAPPITTGALTSSLTDIPTPSNPVTDLTEIDSTDSVILIAPSMFPYKSILPSIEDV